MPADWPVNRKLVEGGRPALPGAQRVPARREMRAAMGVKVREKDKDSGVYWVFINYRGRPTSLKDGTLKAANKVKEQIEARLKLGQDALPKETPTAPTVKEYYDDIFKPVYLESAVAESTAASYTNNFTTHILPALGSRR